MHLQRRHGNQAVQRLVRSDAIQAEPSVDDSGDQYEQEADHVAEQVTRVSEPVVQRTCACGDHTMAGGECEACSEKKQSGLQTKLKVNEPGDIYEREADRVADQVMAATAYPDVSGTPPRIQRSQRPLVQRQPTAGATNPPATGTLPPMLLGRVVSGRCELQRGVFFWKIIPGTRRSSQFRDPTDPPGVIRERAGGGCFNVQIVFLPGHTQMFSLGSSRVAGGWMRDMSLIALVQTVAEGPVLSRSAAVPRVDAASDETDPFFGADVDRSGGTLRDEPEARQGCTSIPRAETGVGKDHGSSFSRPGSYGAVINDSPMLTENIRKEFETVAVVMETGQPLASLIWSIEHDGNEAKVVGVSCHEGPTRGFSETVDRFLHERHVVK